MRKRLLLKTHLSSVIECLRNPLIFPGALYLLTYGEGTVITIQVDLEFDNES